MVFEDLYCFFGRIASVIMWRNELKLHFVEGDNVLELLRTFVVQDMERRSLVCFVEPV